MYETQPRGSKLTSSFNVELDVEKGANAVSTFKKQITVPIIAYLTIQNFLITTLVGAFATGMYYNYSISANQQSARHGLETIHNFTKLQHGFAAEEVNDHIHIFLSQPVLTLKTSADLHSTGVINLDDWSALHRWFYRQIQEFDMVTSITFVEPSSDSFAISSYKDGESVKYNMQLTSSKANRLCPTSVSVNGFCPITNGNTTTYPMTDVDAIDSSGVTTKIASPMFGSPDPTELGSYAMLEAPKNEVSWIPTIRVANAEEGLLGLYFVYPVWTADETFLGSFVGEMDFLITHELLHHLKEESTENTVIYIFQRDEVMIGSSQEEPIVQYDPVLKTAAALRVTDMTDPFIKFTQNYFRSEFSGSFLSVPVETSMDAEAVDPSSGIKYLFQFTALAPGTNLEWMVVVGAPESDYTDRAVTLQASIYNELQINNRNVVVMIISFQLVLMLLVMSLLWLRVARPLRTLVIGMNKAKNFDFTAISEGTFVTSPSGLSEVYQCEKAFFDMTTRFAAAFKQNRNVMQRQSTTLINSVAKTNSLDGSSAVKLPNLDFPSSKS